ncbi:vomeronasal type-2 receptor 26-like [Engystomops pustulosus]|uniref:vomeronasal type-2 receptor 26-like n=1 Tax=Engystomops pustulosus TaxID=76066 RepID=UPI003AFB3138
MTLSTVVTKVRSTIPQCKLPGFQSETTYEYYQEGDVIIGGSSLVPSCSFSDKHYEWVHIDEYKGILSFMFAVDEINRDPNVLPNISLGYHIFDPCWNPWKTLQSAFNILSGSQKEAPNYSCRDHGEVIAFICQSDFFTPQVMNPLLSLYRYMQLNHGFSDNNQNDKELGTPIFRMFPNERTQYETIVHWLKYLRWNFIGIIASPYGGGDTELIELRNMMAKNEICIDFSLRLTNNLQINRNLMASITKSAVKVVLILGMYSKPYGIILYENKDFIQNLTLILPDSWIDAMNTGSFLFPLINCSLIFMLDERNIPHIKAIIDGITSVAHTNDPILEDIWLFYFRCLSRNQKKNNYFQQKLKFPLVNCTDVHLLPKLAYSSDNNLYYTYVSVNILAHAIHNMRGSQNKRKIHPNLHKYVRKVRYTDPTGDIVAFNERGEVPFEWFLWNWAWFKRNDLSNKLHVLLKKVTKDKEIMEIDNVLEVTWKNERAHSQDQTSVLGFIIKIAVALSIADSEICSTCPNEEWPDEKKVNCIPKLFEFLSYNDTFSFIFLGVILLFALVTLFILGSFIYYWDTPIVKANNRTVSFILLVSILLSFLCVFFFLGRPVDITCLLRQVSFGIFFTIGVSSILAKTITVCVAFKATKPGSFWVKWVSFKLSNSVVLVCSSVQVLICIIWLLVSPPYVEYNHHTFPGKIIIQCNEGSDICFYSMLGYMGLLAAVSFVLAFMVRTLPDSFNEAKYITFSILLFCSVWIAMIPAYLSTRGKYMVAVENGCLAAIPPTCPGYVPELKP